MSTTTFGKRVLDRLRYGTHTNPVRDWLVLITFSAMALACIIIWNIQAFDTVASGGVIGAPLQKKDFVLKDPSIDTINAVFANRAVEEEKYENGTYHFADPSQ